MRVIIIEDEKPAARRLHRMLERNNLEPIIMLHSVKESIHWLKNNPNPDLIFLDIQLSDGLSFEIFELVTVESAIIFTTAYNQFALKAFKLNSIDYLLKPIDEEELVQAINKYKKQYKSVENKTIDIDLIKQLLQPKETIYKERFTIQIGQHIKIIETKNIECVYSEDKASYVSLFSGKVYPLDGSLDTILLQLHSTTFFRVNRKHIVNINAIVDIISYTNSRLQLKLKTYKEEDIIVSREKVKDFKNWLA
ncbi:MAG TPA: response regulator transcription factor [Lutibacter sp.]|nr:response regulator transcription factor [Lutibacter sp.]